MHLGRILNFPVPLTTNKGHFTQVQSMSFCQNSQVRAHFFLNEFGVGGKNSLYFYHGVSVPSLDNLSGALFCREKQTHICLRHYSNAVPPNQFLFLLSLITFLRFFTLQCGYMSIVKGTSTLIDLVHINFLWVLSTCSSCYCQLKVNNQRKLGRHELKESDSKESTRLGP